MLYPSLIFVFSASSASLRMWILESQPTISERIESSWGSSLRCKGCETFCIIEANRTLFCRQELQKLIIRIARGSDTEMSEQFPVRLQIYSRCTILSTSEYELRASLNLCQGGMRISAHCSTSSYTMSFNLNLKSRRVKNAKEVQVST